MPNIDKLAREFYAAKPNEKLRNDLAKACQPYIIATVNWVCEDSVWDRDDLNSHLSDRLIYLIDTGYVPNCKKFNIILVHHLRNMARNWISDTQRKKERRIQTKQISTDSKLLVHYPDPYDFSQEYEDRDFINKLRNQLRHPKQILIFEEMSQGMLEITTLARRLNMGANTVKNHIEGIKKIAKRLKNDC